MGMVTSYPLTWVTDTLAVGPAPMSNAHLESLQHQGVTAILNLCAEYCDLHEIETDGGFEVYYLPVHDEEAPELAALEEALAWLDEAQYLGKKVLIHCRHGIGRTGTVLNAYLLRRGLGSKLAGKMLKPLRSKPANFEQWWAVRKYGKSTGKLVIREPSLEYQEQLDLAPFFEDYEKLAAIVEDRMHGVSAARCGKGHDSCCATPLRVQFIEAVHLVHRINTSLTSEERLASIERAVAVARREREEQFAAQEAGAQTSFCLFDAQTRCPLSVKGACQLYAHRPLRCRSFDLPERAKLELFAWLDVDLAQLSSQLFMAFSGQLVNEQLQTFSLADVVSGRFIQHFFHMIIEETPHR